MISLNLDEDLFLMHNSSMYPIDFIRKVLIGELSSMLPKGKKGYPYELFILISIGIEFLGACQDDYNWFFYKKGLNKERFLIGLNLFPNQYIRYNNFLYKKLRCGMAHIFAPVPGLGIGENKHGTGNLICKIERDEIIELTLNIEDFFDDFKNACEKIISKIKAKDFSKDSKIYKPFIFVPLS